jgi:hypothetical protein
MMGEFSFDKVLAANDTEYDEVEAYGIKVRIGSLDSADMIEWIEDNDVPAKKREAGLRLLVKSLVDDEGNRVPKERFEEFLESFRHKNAQANGRVIKKILVLNGLQKAGGVESAKNASGGASPAASPIDSPSPFVAQT